MKTIRVLLADDHRLFREGVRQILELSDEFEVVGEACHGQAAVDLAVALQPDVVLMDIRMPGLDGVQATRLITSQLPTIGIVILTMYRQEDYVFEAIKAGARGYLLKDTDSQTLLETVRAIRRGDAMLDPEMAARVLNEFRRVSQALSDADPETRLNAGEAEVLRLVADGEGNKAIASRLCISDATVANRLREIYQKLHVTNRTQATLVALRRGLISLEREVP